MKFLSSMIKYGTVLGLILGGSLAKKRELYFKEMITSNSIWSAGQKWMVSADY